MHILVFGPGIPDPPFPNEILIQKRNFEGREIQVHIVGCWPGVPDSPFPNANS